MSLAADSATRGGRLVGRVALVTGASREIGSAIALRLASEGAAVAVAVGNDRDRGERLADSIVTAGGRAIALSGDVTVLSSVEAMVEQTITAFGRLDILVNNAGAFGRAPLDQLRAEEWDRVFAVNCKGTFLCSVAAARRMSAQRSGAIVNIAGASAHRSFPGGGAYGPSKAAVANLTEQMAIELADRGIRVNGVSPGPIRGEASNWRQTEPALVRQVDRIPLKRVGTPADVAAAVAYLASEDAAYVTGQMLIVDGGSVATWYLA
jgi:3-oxoacyl-[acyl-carrier protein] reductase